MLALANGVAGITSRQYIAPPPPLQVLKSIDAGSQVGSSPDKVGCIFARVERSNVERYIR